MKLNLRLRLIAGATLIATGSAMAVLSAAGGGMEHLGRTLYNFTGAPDGAYPNGDLIVDDAGTYYGTTSLGGVITSDCSAGCGTVYKIVDGVESVIYRFAGGSDGAVPYDGLLRDAEGNLYGVTRVGGDNNVGTVFRISQDGTKTTLHSFAGGTADGASPNGDLIADAEGNLYGTTYSGGSDSCEGAGCGTVFKVTPGGEESILHAFTGVANLDGKNPEGGLVADADGNFFGTTYGGGGRVHCGPDGCGTIFEITPDGQTTLIHRFDGSRSGGHPRDRLLRDAEGNFYGTTFNGGFKNFGAVWKVTADGATETVLYFFHHHRDGEGVGSGLVVDAEGNFYGTTLYGSENLTGQVYRLSPEGRIDILYTFADADIRVPGIAPGRMIIDRQGNLIGATIYGGNSGNCSPFGCGTIFQVKN